MRTNTRRCLRVLLLLGTLRLVSPPPLFSSTIYVKYVRRLRNGERRVSFEKAIGIPCRQRTVFDTPYESQETTNPFGDSLACGLKRNQHFYRYDVPDNEEAFWLRVLRTNPFVVEVRSLTEEKNILWAFRVMGETANMADAVVLIGPGRPPARKGQKSTAEGLSEASGKKRSAAIMDKKQEGSSAPDSGQGFFEQTNASTCPSVSAFLPDKSIPSTDIKTLLLSFLSRTIACRGGRYRLIASDADFVHLQVEHLKGEVIPGRGFWERFELMAVFFPLQRGFKLHMFLDAKYAAGLGSDPPQESAFSSVEPEFYKQESDYVQALLTATKAFLDERATEP
jgi:hypothetical protein